MVDISFNYYIMVILVILNELIIFICLQPSMFFVIFPTADLNDLLYRFQINKFNVKPDSITLFESFVKLSIIYFKRHLTLLIFTLRFNPVISELYFQTKAMFIALNPGRAMTLQYLPLSPTANINSIIKMINNTNKQISLNFSKFLYPNKYCIIIKFHCYNLRCNI